MDWEGPGSRRIYLLAETAKTLETAARWAADCLNYKLDRFRPTVLHANPNDAMFFRWIPRSASEFARASVDVDGSVAEFRLGGLKGNHEGNGSQEEF